MAVKVHAGIYKADALLNTPAFLVFILDVWSQQTGGGGRVGCNGFRGPRVGQEPWNMAGMTDIYRSVAVFWRTEKHLGVYCFKYMKWGRLCKL